MPPSSKQELWWNGFGPNFQTAEALEIQKLLLNSVLFSFQTGALRCLAKRPAHIPCSYVVLTCFIIFIKVGFLSTSAMFYQWVGYLKCQIPMVDQPPQKMLGRSIRPQLSGASVCQRPRRNSLRPRQEWGPPEGDGPPETSSLGYPKGVLMLKSDPESMGWGKLGEWPSKKGDALLLKLHHPNDHQWPTVRGVLAKSGVWKLVIMCKPNSKPLPRLPKMAVKIIPKQWVCHRLDRSHWGLISTDDASDEKRGDALCYKVVRPQLDFLPTKKREFVTWFNHRGFSVDLCYTSWCEEELELGFMVRLIVSL